MNREFLRNIKGFEEISDDVINKIMEQNGADIEKFKDDAETAGRKLETANQTIDSLTNEMRVLKENNASADEWKSKFEALEQQIRTEKEAAEAERIRAEREASVLELFNSAATDENGKTLVWAHEAIKSDYLKKFGEALENKANEAKTAKEIFHELTKDDAGAFKGITAAVVPGGKPIQTGITKEDFSKMGYMERLEMKTNSPELYKTFTEGDKK